MRSFRKILANYNADHDKWAALEGLKPAIISCALTSRARDIDELKQALKTGAFHWKACRAPYRSRNLSVTRHTELCAHLNIEATDPFPSQKTALYINRDGSLHIQKPRPPKKFSFTIKASPEHRENAEWFVALTEDERDDFISQCRNQTK